MLWTTKRFVNNFIFMLSETNLVFMLFETNLVFMLFALMLFGDSPIYSVLKLVGGNILRSVIIYVGENLVYSNDDLSHDHVI